MLLLCTVKYVALLAKIDNLTKLSSIIPWSMLVTPEEG
jgi:hypothetical protein